MKEADFDSLVQEYQAQVEKTKTEIEDLALKNIAPQISNTNVYKLFHPWLINVGICVYICDYLIKSGNFADWKWWSLMIFVAYMTQVFRYKGQK